jgi:WD40 repeat protein
LQGNIYALDTSADGRIVAIWVLGADLGVTLMDPAKGTVLQRIPAEVLPIALSPDGRLVATGTIPPPFQFRVAGPDISLWEVGSPRRLALLHGLQAKITGLTFSPEGGLLASVTEDGSLNLLRVPSGEGVWTLQADGGVKQAAFSSDGALLATWARPTSGDQWTLGVWDARKFTQIANANFAPLDKDEHALQLMFGPPGSDQVLFRTSKRTDIWHYLSPQNFVNLLSQNVSAISPDGRVAVTIGGYVGSGPNGYCPVTFWDLLLHSPLVTKNSPPGTLITVAAFSKDGRRLVCGTNGGEIIVWEP